MCYFFLKSIEWNGVHVKHCWKKKLTTSAAAKEICSVEAKGTVKLFLKVQVLGHWHWRQLINHRWWKPATSCTNIWHLAVQCGPSQGTVWHLHELAFRTDFLYMIKFNYKNNKSWQWNHQYGKLRAGNHDYKHWSSNKLCAVNNKLERNIQANETSSEYHIRIMSKISAYVPSTNMFMRY